MKISEYQVLLIIHYLVSIIASCPSEADCNVWLNAPTISNIRELLIEIRNQQSNELREIE